MLSGKQIVITVHFCGIIKLCTGCLMFILKRNGPDRRKIMLERLPDTAGILRVIAEN